MSYENHIIDRPELRLPDFAPHSISAQEAFFLEKALTIIRARTIGDTKYGLALTGTIDALYAGVFMGKQQTPLDSPPETAKRQRAGKRGNAKVIQLAVRAVGRR